VDRRRQLSLCAVMIGLPLGCHQRLFLPSGADAATDAAGNDGLAPLTLDVAVTGCATFDVATVACTGVAPLTVSFSPVGSTELTSFLWTFGDGSPPSTDRAPLHTYTLPGSYDVNVTGGGTVGTVSQLRRSLIVVQPVATGAACDIDGQCGDGLGCLCQPGTGCGPGFVRGICTTSCQTGFCGAGAVCVAYAPPSPTDAGAGTPSGAPICLSTCQANADCGPGFVCEQLLAGASNSGWVRGCLPLGAAGDLGASCRNAVGLLDGTHCTTGLCADVGTLGLCTAPCDAAHACPASTACAHLTDGSQLCLAACSTAQPCTRDPALSCRGVTPPDAGADAGGVLVISGAQSGATYCAPD
jgi:PKD repeat protein